ncbi:MAG: NAD-dependent epimerase/dehydratase family protein [Rickettsiales bacterium TMED289]|nr:MAG: NAD-dependent epimerase/dehydratase family protein [Rickettsiales bacterium TMED289]|tara:strand:- start:309 stop:1010 length:702 start_codon:yes stop_codon:yes gene_type:complete
MKVKILVTGGDGRFASILKKKNKLLKLVFLNKIQCNILNFQSIIKCIKKYKPSAIFHCAGLSRPMEIHKKNITKSIDLNIIGTANIVKACEKFNIKLIYLSSGYVYEGIKGNYSEKDGVKPFNNYGWSKLGGECSANMYKNSLILRVTMTEKPFRFKSAYTNLISNFMYHEDFVDLLPKLLKRKGVINVGGKTQSVYKFVKNNNPNVKKSKLKKTSNFPLKQSMNLSKMKKLI